VHTLRQVRRYLLQAGIPINKLKNPGLPAGIGWHWSCNQLARACNDQLLYEEERRKQSRQRAYSN